MNNTIDASDSSKANLEKLDVGYEYLQVVGTVINLTEFPMEIRGSDLSWGKWIKSPVNAPARDVSTFASQGRDMSPSGTEGWAEWSINGAVIRISFNCPLRGSNSQGITCTPPIYNVFATGTGGNVNQCTFKIVPK